MGLNKKSILSEVIADWGALNRSQKWLFFLYAIVLSPHIRTLFRVIEARIGLSFIVEYSDTLLVVIAILGSISVFKNKLHFADIAFVLCVAILHLLSPILYSETVLFANKNAGFFIFSCLPLYLVGRTIDSKTSTTLFVAIAYIGLVLEVLLLFFLGMEVNESGEVRSRMMTRAYYLLPFVLLLLWNAIERGRVVDYIAPLIGVFVLFSLGTRGPILCLVIFIALYLVLFKKFKHGKIVKTIIVLFAIVFYSYSFQILLFTSMLSSSVGLSTRVYDSILDKQMLNIEESSGRDMIYQDVINYLDAHNIYFSAELYADRIVTGLDTYAHNLELEILCEFGLIGGAIILMIILSIIIKAFRKEWNTEKASFLLIFFCSSIMQLQFSGSWLRSGIFWFFIGMCISMNELTIIKHKKNINNESASVNI